MIAVRLLFGIPLLQLLNEFQLVLKPNQVVLGAEVFRASALEVTLEEVTQVRLEVRVQVITSPAAAPVGLNVDPFAPRTGLPLIFH